MFLVSCTKSAFSPVDAKASLTILNTLLEDTLHASATLFSEISVVLDYINKHYKLFSNFGYELLFFPTDVFEEEALPSFI